MTILAQTPSITHYGIADGFSNGEILAIYQDQKGYIWVSTAYGLYRFDGKKWTIFSAKDGLINDGFDQIYESKDGQIHFSFSFLRKMRLARRQSTFLTHQSISYDGRKWHTRSGKDLQNWSFGRLFTDKKAPKWVPLTKHAEQVDLDMMLKINDEKIKKDWYNLYSIYAESSEHFYIGAWKGWIECTPDTFINHLQHHYPNSTARIYQIEKVKNQFWLKTDEGIKVFDGKQFLEDIVPKDLQRDVTNTMTVDATQKIWFSTIIGLYCYDGVQFKRYSTQNGLPHNRLGNMFIDSQQRIWLHVKKGLGLYKATPDAIQLVAIMDTSLSAKEMGHYWFFQDRIVFEDYEGNIWFNTADGIACLHNFDFTHYQPKHAQHSKWVTTAVMDTQQNIWMGTWYNGITVCPTNSKDTCWQYTAQNGLIGDHIYQMSTNGLGTIWLGTDKGLVRYNQNDFATVPLDDSTAQQLTNLTQLPDQTTTLSTGVYQLLNTTDQSLYFVQNGIVLRYRPSQQSFQIIPFKANATTILTLKKVVSISYNPVIHCLYEDQNEVVWAYQDEGLFRLERDTFRLVGSKAYLGIIIDMAQDEQGNFWMVDQENGGIIRYDGKYAIRFDERDGLSTNKIRSITIQNDYAYLGTTKGIDRFNIRLFNTEEIVAIKNIGQAEGFYPVVCGYFNYLSPKGNIWFNSEKGISAYHINTRESVPPKLHLTDILLNQEPVDWITFVDSLDPQTRLPKHLALNHQENTLTFAYQSITTQNDQNIYYQYQLTGIDTTWQTPTQHTLATYANLPAGDYAFKVKVTNQLPYWKQKHETFYFTILPAIWQRFWFITILIGLAISSIVLWSWGVYWFTKRYSI